MARAPTAVKSKSPKPASRSTTSPASTARGRAKSAKRSDEVPVDKWEPHDAAQAAVQGWELFECIDERTLKVFYEVHPANEVAALAKKGDALAIKALRMVFHSKTQFHEVIKKRRKA